MTSRTHHLPPAQRFRRRVNGRPGHGLQPLRLAGQGRYYRCPRCGARTLIRSARLDYFNPPTSPFADDLRRRFGPVPADRCAYDFRCRGCASPVRLLLWAQERGMGGPWDCLVGTVIELS